MQTLSQLPTLINTNSLEKVGVRIPAADSTDVSEQTDVVFADLITDAETKKPAANTDTLSIQLAKNTNQHSTTVEVDSETAPDKTETTADTPEPSSDLPKVNSEANSQMKISLLDERGPAIPARLPEKEHVPPPTFGKTDTNDKLGAKTTLLHGAATTTHSAYVAKPAQSEQTNEITQNRPTPAATASQSLAEQTVRLSGTSTAPSENAQLGTTKQGALAVTSLLNHAETSDLLRTPGTHGPPTREKPQSTETVTADGVKTKNTAPMHEQLAQVPAPSKGEKHIEYQSAKQPELTQNHTPNASVVSSQITPAIQTVNVPGTPITTLQPLDPKQRDALDFVTSFELSTKATSPQNATTPLQTTHPQHDARQIAQQLALNFSKQQDGTTVIRLNPEELGQVRMTLRSVDGAMVMTIMAERPETAEIMRRNIGELAQEFESLGYDGLNFSFDGEKTSSQGESKQQNSADSDINLGQIDAPTTASTTTNTTPSGRLDIRL